ncbi:Zinc finger matrin-type protein 1 [Dissostichus eleginoides]|uniref:Zinc finger matrin-type protein 1 n=1 Tax=Dissostichus eleginoides TaxID=100907 RepID=A0AAD9FG36_DISEL|nr:Zinc finger matrin-type protein 1 [Dissostichus eleginoides]
MEDRSVCTPLLAESEAQNNTTSTPNAASATGADKVINTQTDRAQVEGDKSEEELLKSLLTYDHCHVCDAALLYESQRVSHYEGKKHAQKLRVYLQAKRTEKIQESTRPQRTMTMDKDQFCELCNMVFSSQVVAKSHYDGKVHAKNIRKQGLQPPAVDRMLPEDGTEHLLDPTAPNTAPKKDVDLKDPNKYCALCAASFNNPQMALQHYNGRKHQRNQARQDLLKDLRDNVQEADSLMCQMCSIQFNSVEMYQAHMQGNKHQIREKKVVHLCKSQQKDYSTFADELADFIQVQKARGIKPKAGQAQPPPISHPPHPSRPGCHYTVEGWRPPYQGPSWLSHGWDYKRPPPALPGPPLFSSQPTRKRRHRKHEHRRREKRRIKRSRRERDRRARDEDSEKDKKRRKQRRRDDDSVEGRREDSGGSGEERKKGKTPGKRRRRENKLKEEDLEAEGGEREGMKLHRQQEKKVSAASLGYRATDAYEHTYWRLDKMILLPLAWTLWTVSLWTLGSSQTLLQEPLTVIYPKIFSSSSIECDCADVLCDSVYWFRSISNNSKMEFIGQGNHADRITLGKGVDESRFKLISKSKKLFALQIINLTKEDTGTYSCVLKKKNTTWKPGTLLLPGVTAQIIKTDTKPTVKSVCRCNKSPKAVDGCGSLVFWPLVGLFTALVLTLVGTLYYYSRLPKKCRHHCVK